MSRDSLGVARINPCKNLSNPGDIIHWLPFSFVFIIINQTEKEIKNIHTPGKKIVFVEKIYFSVICILFFYLAILKDFLVM